jgi:hypothetical protein
MSEPINPEEPIKKKRGRKKKSDLAPENVSTSIEEIQEVVVTTAKKRGRKPKGGKLYIKENDNNIEQNSTSNVILHLKCSLKDVENMDVERNAIVTNPLEYNPIVPPDIQAYENVDNPNYFELEEQRNQTKIAYVEPQTNRLCSVCKTNDVTVSDNTDNPEDIEDVDIKDVTTKLKEMKIKLYRSNNEDKKSACFWCTYDFDNQSCHIPKYEMDEEIHGYGSFCRPECAAAYLMKENIDDSTKFERYHLLNQIYSKVYNYKKNIRPAPDPHYLLDKFYGNLSIKEYRKLLKSEHMMLIIEKPMTRILPELHEDNEDIGNSQFNGQSTGNAGVYKVKRQSEKQKGPSKNEIIRENFGI